MTEDNRRQNIASELKRASSAAADGQLLLAQGSPEGVVGRAYYFAFHCARALLLSRGLETKTHAGVAHLINFHFVQSGLLAADVARILPQLERERQDADYDTAAVFTKEMAAEWLSRAQRYAEAVKAILVMEGWLDLP